MTQKAQAFMTPFKFPAPGSQIVVYDLEYTSWEGSHARGWSGPDEHREVVEIGAVRLHVGVDGLSRHADGIFHCYVRPRIHPLLSDYFKALTGIRQEDVDTSGLDFATAYRQLADFAGEKAELWSFGWDNAVLAENMELNGLFAADMPFSLRFRDIRADLCAATGADPKQAQSSALPSLIGIKPDGDQHTALGDAGNLVLVLEELDRRRRGAGPGHVFNLEK
ncbi:3'-5' exonuclease [Radicibacter daui]|uniref:3'-5' exonuclease n=1 Tax=Radicibacter daui TaxID=3064829 RepID=UPI00404699C6